MIIASMFILLACVFDPKATAAMTPLGWVCLAAVELLLAGENNGSGNAMGRVSVSFTRVLTENDARRAFRSRYDGWLGCVGQDDRSADGAIDRVSP